MYYILAEFEGGKWVYNFSDFDRSVVMAEREAERDNGVMAKHLRVLKQHSSDMADINKAIDILNA